VLYVLLRDCIKGLRHQDGLHDTQFLWHYLVTYRTCKIGRARHGTIRHGREWVEYDDAEARYNLHTTPGDVASTVRIEVLDISLHPPLDISLHPPKLIWNRDVDARQVS